MEVLFSLTVSIFIFYVMISLYIHSFKSFELQSALNSIRENSELASELLRHVIKNAGYIGCAKLTDDFPLIDLPNYPFNKKNKIIVNKNAITIRQADLVHTYLNEAMQNLVTLKAFVLPRFKSGEILLVSDCETAELFVVKHVMQDKQTQVITTQHPLHKQYGKYAEVSHFKVDTFFVNDTGRKYADGTTINALYQSDLLHRKTEIVEGISDLQASLEAQGITLSFSVKNPPFKKPWHIFISF